MSTPFSSSVSSKTFLLARKAGVKALKPFQQQIFNHLVGRGFKQPVYRRDFIESRVYANKLLTDAGFDAYYDVAHKSTPQNEVESSSNPAHTDGFDINNPISSIIGIPGIGKTLGVVIALSEMINKERSVNEHEGGNGRFKIHIGHDKRQEARLKRFMSSRISRIITKTTLLIPHTLIICPSRETCMSIYKKTQQFELSSLVIAGGYGYKRKAALVSLINSKRRNKGLTSLGDNADIIIGTPEMILRLIYGKLEIYELDPNVLKTIVLSEAHILLHGKDFLKINQVFEVFQNCYSELPRVVLTSVSRTSAIIDFTQKTLEQIEWVTDSSKICLKQFFISFSGQDKISKLLEQELVGKIVIFCNTIKSAQFVYNVLSERGIKTYLLHGEKSYRGRSKGLYNFLRAETGVMVATDVFSRGNKLGKVDGFISFDFPSNIADYLSRLNVISGSNGWVKTFFAKKHKELVRKIAEVSELDLMKFQNSEPIKPVRIVPVRTVKPIKRNITSPAKKLWLKKLYYKNKIMKEVLFLRKRKILGKKQLMPRMPDSKVESFDSQEIIRMQRSKDGFVQIFPKRRSIDYIKRVRCAETGRL